MKTYAAFLLVGLLLSSLHIHAQNEAVIPDSAASKADSVIDAGVKTVPDSTPHRYINYPKRAAIRSAVLPGWGQAYNKKYWKIPVIYTALGITTYVFVDNIKTYKEYKFAYAARIKAQSGLPADSTDYNQLAQLYKIISPESIRNARDQFRKYVDYSVLFFIVFWGLNVVDATVDAHLRSFDITPDLTMKIKPSFSSPPPGKFPAPGLSVVFTIGKHKSAGKGIALK